MPSTLTSIPSPASNESFAWIPVLFISNGESPRGMTLGFNRRLAPQPTKQDAYNAAREACIATAAAIGFTVERVLACLLPKKRGKRMAPKLDGCPPAPKSETCIKWLIRTLTGAVLAKCDSHAAAVQRIEQCQSQPGTYPDWLADLCIHRTEVSHA